MFMESLKRRAGSLRQRVRTGSFRKCLRAMSGLASCVPCGGGRSKYVDNESHQRDKDISAMLKKWNRDERDVVQILMLGIGESGKSTITKQMKIIHVNGFSDCERQEKVPDIRKNIRDSILSICGAMGRLGISLHDDILQPKLDHLMTEAVKESFDYSQEFYDNIRVLWSDAGVQECYRRSNEYQLIDSAKYFLDRLDVVRQDEYVPSEQDILRCRVMTNSIQRINYSVRDGKKDVQFSVYDVGGQRGERRRWIQVFDMTTAVLFVVDASSFDLALREDISANRLIEALETFQQVWNSRWLRNVSCILFINKIDLLEEKIRAGHTLDDLINTMDPSNVFYNLFAQFQNFPKPKDSERREFEDAFPADPPPDAQGAANGRRPPTDAQGTAHAWRPRSKSRAAAQPARTDISDETVRTAAFLKHIFLQIVCAPRYDDFGLDWHRDHNFEYFYTCAVDTDNIRKVLEGCRTIIIKKHLQKFGIAI